MKGLELARAFYEQHGAPMLHEQFPALEGLIAVGLVGSGSECFGFDDETSQDHDFEPGFCLFLPDDESLVDRRASFLLERAYAKLPKEFMGFHRGALSPVGGNRHGVMRIGDFYEAKTGRRDGNLTQTDWLTLPDYALAEAVNGEVFRDDRGEFSRIRTALQTPPENVRKKKLAGQLLLMGQSGQYNFARCLKHRESGAAQLAVVEFIRSTMQTVFLLNQRYMPYYKWSFRALRQLPLLADTADALEFLLFTENSAPGIRQKSACIEQLAEAIIRELRAQGLSAADGNDLERHAYTVNNNIRDGELRNLHILAAV